MKQQFLHYPTFSAGEVLTKDLLESIVNYSDEQMRMTRSQIQGYGIVSGLTYSYSKGCLQLNPGFGFTPNGNAICIGDVTSYYYMEVQSNGWSKLTIEKTEKAIKLKKTDKDVLVIKYERVPQNSLKCSQDSCDMIHIRTHVVFTPYLVPVKSLEKVAVYDKFSSQRLYLNKPPRIRELLVTNYLHDSVRECFYKNSSLLLKRLVEIESLFATKEKPLGFLFSYKRNYEVRTDINNAIAILTKYNKMSMNVTIPNKMSSRLPISKQEQVKMEAASPDIPMYFLHFLDDMAEAYNEWADSYASFLDKYEHHLLHTDMEFDPDSLLIGLTDGGEKEEYRNYFVPANFKEFNDDVDALEIITKRLCVMVQRFAGTSYKWDSRKVSLCSVNPHAKLADKPIPFYYNNTVGFSKIWTLKANSDAPDNAIWADACAAGAAYRNEALAFDSPLDCYQVGGYYYRNVDTVVSELNSLISTYDLQLTVEKVGLLELSSRWPKLLDSLSSLYKTGVLKDFSAESDALKKLVTRRFNTSRMPEAKRNDLFDKIKDFKIDYTFLVNEKDIHRKEIAMLKALQEIAKLRDNEKFRFPDYRYMPRKSVLYVAHFGKKVIFCFSA